MAANLASCEAYRYTPDELRTVRADQLCPRETLEGGADRAPYGEGLPGHGAVRQIGKDGASFDAEVALIDLGEPSGGATLVVVQPLAPRRPFVVEVPPPPSRAAVGGERDEVPLGANRPVLSSRTLMGSAAKFLEQFESGPGYELPDNFGRFEEARVRREERVAALRSLDGGDAGMQEVDPRKLIADVRARLISRATVRGIEIVSKCVCESIRVHPRAFAQALYELTENAINATRRKVPVLLEIERTGTGNVLCQVRDQGKGMSRHVLGGLGEPHPTLLRLGTGLGIPFAWTVAEKHHGLLRFESGRNAGTTATMWLPGDERRQVN